MTSPADTNDREIATTRLINAPRELVWKVWIEPDHIAKWWGPNGFTNTIKTMEVKPGGVWSFIMHGPDGTDYPNVIEYLEVVQPERLVYLHGDEGGSPEQTFHVTVTFQERDGKTELAMKMVFATAAQRDQVIQDHGALDGQKQTLNKLEEYLQKQQP